MIYNEEKLKNIATYAVVHGIEKAAVNFNIKQESVTRYIRDAKLKGLIDEKDMVFDKKPNVLILDIETSPILAGVWGLWKQNYI